MGFLNQALKLWLYFLFLLQYGLILLYQYYLHFKSLLFSKFNPKTTIVKTPFGKVDPDVFVSTKELITAKGYNVVDYEFTTGDGYQLTVWRLAPEQETRVSRKHPVLVLHGLVDCGISWFIHKDKKRTLPYMLADAGFDVWIGNNRGTRYSKKGQQRPGYWDFSFDQLAKYDLPALVNNILSITQRQKLIVIGHSQGSTQTVASLSQNPQLSSKLLMHIGLGTVLTLHNFDKGSMLSWLGRIPVLQFLRWLGFKTMLIIPPWLVRDVAVITYNTRFFPFAGQYVINFICGFAKANNIRPERLGVIFSHEPGGSSLKNVIQWVQSSLAGRLTKYDYGTEENLKRYGTEKPPKYDFAGLKKCKVKTHLWRGTADSIVSQDDFENLTNKFNHDYVTGHHIDNYNHLDYVWADDSPQKVYKQVVQECIQGTLSQ